MLERMMREAGRRYLAEHGPVAVLGFDAAGDPIVVKLRDCMGFLLDGNTGALHWTSAAGVNGQSPAALFLDAIEMGETER